LLALFGYSCAKNFFAPRPALAQNPSEDNVSKPITAVFQVISHCLVLAAYHFLVVQPRIDMAAVERGAYILDAEGLTTFKAAQLVKDFQAGKIDLSSSDGITAALDEFRAEVRVVLKETVGNAPVFQPRAVVSSDGFVDLTEYVASILNIDFKGKLLNNINSEDGSAVPGFPPE
jgi:hypothetical protein